MGRSKLKRMMPRIALNALVIFAMVIWIIPTLGLFVTSFRPASDVSSTGWWTVLTSPLKFTQYTLENYQTVLSTGGMSTSFRNSFIITIGGTFLSVFIAALAAFGLSRLYFGGRAFFYALIVMMMVVPTQMTFVPVLRLYNKLSLSGTFLACGWHTGYGLPFAVFMLHNFSILCQTTCLRRLISMERLCGPHLYGWPSRFQCRHCIAGNFQFLFIWNDLLVALIYLGGHESVAPLTVRLSSLVGSYGQSWHLLTAAAFVSMFVPLVVFFSLQKYFVRGILGGAEGLI